MKKLVFASNNPNKLDEIRSILKNIEILSLKDINCLEELPETKETLEGNALQKAQFVKDNYGFDCFADDTGLEVIALNSRPGVYSARFAGDNCSSMDNMIKVLSELKGNPNRSASFRTVIALVMDGETHTFDGKVEGDISEDFHGEKGFGYDPIFFPENENRSFAQMTKEEKNKISHRGRAVQKLSDFLN